jgi:ribosomal protein L29
MNTKDINSYTSEELKAHLVELKSGLKKLKFDHAISPIENPNLIKKSKSLVAHDEKNECAEGDTVKVMETRPLSKSKRWRLVEIIEKAK